MAPFIDNSNRLQNKIIGDYNDKTTSFESTGNSGDYFSRHEANSAALGIMTGRVFSEYLLARGWTLKEAALLNMTRFSYDDVEVIGRDIRNVGLSLDIVRDAVYRTWKENRPIDLEFDNEDGTLNSLIAWKVDSGKRTRYGLYSDGGIVVKAHKPKAYKRNRRTNF